MDENLLGYLLGTLEPAEARRVETYVQSHPEALERLEVLRQMLAPLADQEPIEPPPHLVSSTLARIASYHCDFPLAPYPTRHQVDCTPRRWARRIDWVVAASLLVIATGLALPWVAGTWRKQQRMACENNLRKFWVGLQTYSDRSDGAFPRVESEGPRSVAGIFVPLMTDCGTLEDVSVGCPGQEYRSPEKISVSDLERMHRVCPATFQQTAALLSGDYAYCLGYSDAGRHYGLKQTTGDGLPILADAPGKDGTSCNHGCAGQNVLYVGGNVRWCVVPTVGEGGDDIYHNQKKRIQAGVCRTDTVLGSSGTRP